MYEPTLCVSKFKCFVLQSVRPGAHGAIGAALAAPTLISAPKWACVTIMSYYYAGVSIIGVSYVTIRSQGRGQRSAWSAEAPPNFFRDFL